MRALALSLLTAALAGAGPQEEMVENPDYQGWSNCKPGAWVRFQVTLEHGEKTQSETTFKLHELTPDKAIVDEITWVDIKGTAERREVTTPLTIPAKVKKGTTTGGARIEGKNETEITMVVRGRDYKCRLVERRIRSGSREGRDKTWWCDQIPGGVLCRALYTAEDDRPKSVSHHLMDYQGRPAGESIENPEYGAWAGQKPGAWVKWRSQALETTTETLKEVTAGQAVLERCVDFKRSAPTVTKRTVPAKIEKGSDAEGAKVERVAEGDEALEIRGRTYKCRWVELKITTTGPNVVRMKIWRCPEIVGGAAKTAILTRQGAVKTFSNVVDWKAGD